MGDSLQNDSQGSDTDSHVQQVGSKEEVIVVAKDGKHQVEKLVNKRLKVFIRTLSQHLNRH